MFADRVKDTSTTTGTGNFTLSGTAPTGYVSFNTAFGTNVTFDYAIVMDDESEWEVGYGYLSGTTTLVRQTVTASSNANAAVNFSAGTKNVWCNWSAASASTVYNAVPNFQQGMWDQITFLQGAVGQPWAGAAISSGTIQSILGPVEAPGAIRLNASATASSGYRIATTGAIQGKQGLAFRCIGLVYVGSSSFHWWGLHDTTISAVPTDGAYFFIDDDICSARCMNNGTLGVGGAASTLTSGVFYVFDIDYVTDDSVRFVVSELVSGAKVLDQTITGASVPNLTTRTFSSAVLSTRGSASGALADIAYIGTGPARPPYCPVPA